VPPRSETRRKLLNDFLNQDVLSAEDAR
jgi:hypothetical protein